MKPLNFEHATINQSLAEVYLENLSKEFGSVKAVDKLTLRVKDKEFLTLLGPSGCGKTTTLRMIAGLEEPTDGDIHIGGTLVNQLPPKDRDIAMVFQNYALFPHMSVYDNIAFPLKMRNVSASEIGSRVRKTAELLELTEYLERKPKHLSGGQQQRVALGRSIVREPKVFLMDEPLSNLDAKLRVHMRAELKTLQKKLGITTIYVTHDQVEAMTMSDRIALLRNGRLEQLEVPEEMYQHPATNFVGGFIGTPPMNFLEAHLELQGNRTMLSFDGSYIDVSSHRNILQESGSSEFIIGIRPEDMTLSGKELQETIEATVFVVEPLGHEYIIDVRVHDHTMKVRLDSASLRMGDKVWLGFDKQRMHIFEKSGKVLL